MKVVKNMNDLEYRLFKAYFRRFGNNAPYPSQSVWYFKYKDKQYAVLDNRNGILAIYSLGKRINYVKNPKPYQAINSEEPERHILNTEILEKIW
jgi:hypothetical protein